MDLVKVGAVVMCPTSVDLFHFQAYFARIDEVNLKGPQLRAVLELNPSALSEAAALDHERRVKGKRGPLHGIPVLVKDNIATIASEGKVSSATIHFILSFDIRNEHYCRFLQSPRFHRAR